MPGVYLQGGSERGGGGGGKLPHKVTRKWNTALLVFQLVRETREGWEEREWERGRGRDFLVVCVQKTILLHAHSLSHLLYLTNSLSLIFCEIVGQVRQCDATWKKVLITERKILADKVARTISLSLSLPSILLLCRVGHQGLSLNPCATAQLQKQVASEPGCILNWNVPEKLLTVLPSALFFCIQLYFSLRSATILIWI